ncbi:MAG: hypothetical protein MJ252_00130 [archaeon]|nr:hypothetical protein [archaeon]
MEENENLDNKITITLYFNGLQYRLSLPINSTIFDLLSLLSNKFKISLPAYDLFFNDSLLKTSKPVLLTQIIKNYTPIFMLRKKTVYSNYYSLNSNGIGIDLIIENFPSYQEIYRQILLFIRSQRKRPNLSIVNDIPLRICFVEKEEAKKCYNFLNELKYSYDDYKYLKVTVRISQLSSGLEIDYVGRDKDSNSKNINISDYDSEKYITRAEQINKRKNFFNLVHQNLYGGSNSIVRKII